MTPEALRAAEIELELRGGRRFRGPVFCYDTVDSTNSVALARAREGAPEGTLVVADAQSAGRGRFRRHWHSPAGLGLWFSIVLRPPARAEGHAPLAIVAALALADAIRNETRLAPRLKWPNDVWLDGRKLAGILCEMSSSSPGAPVLAAPSSAAPPFIVAGIGLNVNHELGDFPADLRDRATSLRLASGRAQPRKPLLGAIVRAFEERYERFLDAGLAPFIPEWNRLALWIGEPVRLVSGKEIRRGIQLELAPSGGLRLRTTTGVEEIILAGDLEPDRPDLRAGPRNE